MAAWRGSSAATRRPPAQRWRWRSAMRREWSVAIAIVALGAVLAARAPSYFSVENLRDLFLVNMPVLVVAIGAMLVMLTGEIDISVGSAFGVCSVVAGVAATAGVSTPVAVAAACASG